MAPPVAVAPPPPGVTPNFENPETDALRLIIVNAVFIPLSTVFLAARLYTRVRITRKPGADDVFLILAWVTSMVLSALSLWGTNYGLGTHLWEVTLEDFSPMFLKINWIASWIYTPSIAFVKISMVLLYLRISPAKPFRLTCWALIAAMVGALIGAQVAIFVQCIPTKMIWDITVTDGSCINRPLLSVWSGAWNTFLDFAILILPLPTIWGLPLLPKRQKIGLTAVFSVGLFVCAVSLIRMVQMVPLLTTTDISWKTSEAFLWCVVEIDTSIMCASMATFRPFLRKFVPSLIGSTQRRKTGAGSGGGGGSGSGSRHAKNSSSGRTPMHGSHDFPPPTIGSKRGEYGGFSTVEKGSDEWRSVDDHHEEETELVDYKIGVAVSEQGSK